MRKIAFIGTGGTMSSLTVGSIDWSRLAAPAFVAAVPDLAKVAAGQVVVVQPG